MESDRKSQRVTIKTVAQDVGVSIGTVSKVLRDAYGVSEETRQRIHASMQRLGYRPHTAARGMRGQTYTLGVLFSDIRNPFFADIIAGINVALERTQYRPFVGVGQLATWSEEALVEAMIDRQMDGLILVAPSIAPAKLLEIARQTPTVIIGHHSPEATAFDTVNDDDLAGARIAVHHLAENGYKRIALLSHPHGALPDAGVTTQRDVGYQAAMTELGLARHIKVVYAEQTARETQIAARRLLQARSRPEAIFCWTDFVAFEVISVARRLGLSIPDDVAVVGYDNTSYCDLAQNDLTSIDQSGETLGLQATRMLIERLKGRRTAEHFAITPRLVARGSTARPARRSSAG